MALQDPLDRSRGEVLAVDTQPVVVTSGEVEEAGFVAVGQVPRPVPALAQAGRLGLVVVPVALEAGAACLGDQFADGLLCVQQPAALVEAGRRALLAVGRVEDDRALGARPSAPGGVSGVRWTVAPPSVEP